MTAINCYLRPDRIVIHTDTAQYQGDGVVIGFASKCTPLPHLKAAVATRGPLLSLCAIAAGLQIGARDFDGLVADAETLARLVFGSVVEPGCSVTPDTEIVLAGWSTKRNRPESYMLRSVAEGGQAAWQLFVLPAIAGGPVPPPAALAAGGLDPDQDEEKFRPERDGLKLMEVQRRMLIPMTRYGNSATRHLVGGHVVETAISRDGVSQRVIHEWPDRIGAVITPDLSSHVAGKCHEPRHFPGNRKARRAARTLH